MEDYIVKSDTISNLNISVEMEKLSYSCDKCDFVSNFGKCLGRHKRIKHQDIMFKGHIKIHIQSQHESVNYSCVKCEYKSSSRKNLKVHIMKGIKTFSFSVVNASI